MAKRVKYKKSVRVRRSAVADLLQEARDLIRRGRCSAAADAYNEAVMQGYEHGLSLKQTTYMRVQRLLQRCGRKHGWRA